MHHIFERTVLPFFFFKSGNLSEERVQWLDFYHTKTKINHNGTKAKHYKRQAPEMRLWLPVERYKKICSQHVKSPNVSPKRAKKLYFNVSRQNNITRSQPRRLGAFSFNPEHFPIGTQAVCFTITKLIISPLLHQKYDQIWHCFLMKFWKQVFLEM